MAKSRTEKSCFESSWGGGFITAGQALAERMCERAARRDGKALTDRFWTREGWAQFYRAQTRHAAALLKAFPFAQIIRGLRTPDGLKAYSLGAPWLADVIAAAPAADAPEAPDVPEVGEGPSTPRPKGETTLDKLRGL